MTQSTRWILFLACLIPSACSYEPTMAAEASERPNVLFIAIDDLNDWIGVLGGHPQTVTPNIDRLAGRGIAFTNAHCASPACNPSRAAVFSGMMPWKTGVWSNESKKLFALHPDAKVIPRAFSDAGYLTMGTGKLMHSSGSDNRVMFHQHMNVEQRWSPFTREEVAYTEEELPSKGSDHPEHIVHASGIPPIRLPLNGMPSDRKPDSPDGESFDWGPMPVSDSAMGDAQSATWAVERLSREHQQPFFLGVGFYRPHIPLWAPATYFARFDGQTIQLPPYLANDLDDLSETGRRWAIDAITAGLHSTVIQHNQWHEAVKAYLACITFVDAQVGRLIDALDQSPHANNTIVVLWSDHGWHLGEKDHWGKWTGWERSTRVPLIMVPARQMSGQFTQVGQRCDEPVSLIDLYPTLVDLCGVTPPQSLDGQSLVPLLRDPQSPTDRIAVTSFDPGNVSLRWKRWRYIRYADGSEELYDLQSDPHEWKNVAKEERNAAVLERFRRRIPTGALGEK